jgi:hypothetical protein
VHKSESLVLTGEDGPVLGRDFQLRVGLEVIGGPLEDPASWTVSPSPANVTVAVRNALTSLWPSPAVQIPRGFLPLLYEWADIDARERALGIESGSGPPGWRWPLS